MSSTRQSRTTEKPDYGVDAPDVVRRLLIIGVAGIVLAALAPQLPQPYAQIARSLAVSGWFCGGTALVMLWGSRFGKFLLRDRVLSRLSWRGDEQVLDVGCGRGLMLIGAARHLTSGRAIGIDIWQIEDQSGNSAQATLRNAQLEGVADRVTVQTADARELPFADGSFDLVVSSFALHNIYQRAERERALAQIVRVLKPGGQLAIADIRHAPGYARFFRAQGLEAVRVSWPNFLFVTPTLTVTARKPTTPLSRGTP